MTEFAYRIGADQSSNRSAPIFISFLLSSKSTSGPTPSERQTAVDDLIIKLKENSMEAWDLSNDEMSKDHARFMIGGKVAVENERVFMFGAFLSLVLPACTLLSADPSSPLSFLAEFPERPNALYKYLHSLEEARAGKPWNISLFHYRNHGAGRSRSLLLFLPQS